MIPTLNEAGSIAATIERTRGLGECEIIVADGGSTDGTLQQAAAADRCLSVEPGRAAQQNAGAQQSQADVLLFLHADCWLEDGAFDAMRSALDDPHVIGGCFQQRIEADGRRYRLLEWGNAQRVRRLRWAYGDQGIFLWRRKFESVGGFANVRLMEDWLLSKRLKHEGDFVLLESKIHISARRWQRKGVIRQTLWNWLFITLAQCGVSPNRLADFYPHVR